MKFLRFFFFFFIAIIFFITFINYEGNKFYYLFFTLTFNIFFINKLNRDSYFCEIFLSLYLWLGFWLKFSLLSLYSNFTFSHSEGFDKDSAINISELDKVLIIASIFFICINIGFFLVKKVFRLYHVSSLYDNSNLLKFYKKFKNIILLLFIIFITVITFFNYHYKIYQKGLINLNISSYIQLLASYLINLLIPFFLSIVLFLEMHLNKSYITIGFLILFESISTSVSQLSKFFFINWIPFFLSIFKMQKYNKFNFGLRNIFIITFCSFFVFSISFYSITKLRYISYNLKNDSFSFNKKDFIDLKNEFIYIVVNRWVGIDSLYIVNQKYDQLNFKLFINSFSEKKEWKNNTFYNENFLKLKQSNFTNKFNQALKGFPLPGYISFLFYTGNIFFVSISLVVISILLFFFEKFISYLTFNNYVSAAFFSHLVVYRLIHFGYYPLGTINFLIAIFITVICYYFIIKLLLNPKKIK